MGFATPCAIGPYGSSCGDLYQDCIPVNLTDGGASAFCGFVVAGMGSPCDQADLCPSPLNCSSTSNTCVAVSYTHLAGATRRGAKV